MVWALIVIRLWGNLSGTVDVETIYPTREACEADRRYWDQNHPQMREYAECRLVPFSESSTR